MGTYVTTKTNVTDKRQVAEGEYIAGPDSIMSLPYSIAVAPGSSVRIAGSDSSQIVADVLTNQDSTMGKILGLQAQMAQGMFEMAPRLVAESKGLEVTGQPAISKNTIYIIAGIALLLLFMRR